MNSEHQDSPSLQITEVVLPGLVEPAGLQIKQRTLPAPAEGEALIQMEATGISFAEQQMRRGKYPGQPAFPFVPGYDLVGTVRAVGAGVSPTLIGTRVAVMTKAGGWASHVVRPANALIPVPGTLDPALIETILVSGVTAWQMLYRKAKVKPGQTILVHGANGGVGTVLSQVAVHGGIRVLGTASPRHHEALRAMGVEPIDYNDTGLVQRVAELTPQGAHAVFDHLGIASARESFKMLAPGGSLIAYGNAAAMHEAESPFTVFAKFIAQIALWNLLPNSRSASFYNFWEGSRIGPKEFRKRMNEDLAALIDLLMQGVINPPIAARFPLTEASAAMTLAESRTVQGKVVLTP
jgi:NADPH:quinone reductase-like Zn-dependent oxidoreductase